MQISASPAARSCWPGGGIPTPSAVEQGTALGWDGRLLFVGLTAAMGLATLAYLALAAYLVLLIGTKVATRCLTPSERVEAGAKGVTG